MESTRQNKVARLLQKDLGDIFLKDYKAAFPGTMITVTQVKVTKDLQIAKVYLSLFATKEKEVMFKKIQKKTKEIRTKLAYRVRNQMKAVPELEFFIDDSLDYIENIENLLKD